MEIYFAAEPSDQPGFAAKDISCSLFHELLTSPVILSQSSM
jgi:hypothetical protein